MGLGNLILILGIFLVGMAQNLPMFLAGRFCQGVGAVSASAAARSYIVEIAPVPHRGKFLGFYNVMYQVGAILVSGTAIGFGMKKDEWGWRGIVLLGVRRVLDQIVILADEIPALWSCDQHCRLVLHTGIPSMALRSKEGRTGNRHLGTISHSGR